MPPSAAAPVAPLDAPPIPEEPVAPAVEPVAPLDAPVPAPVVELPVVELPVELPLVAFPVVELPVELPVVELPVVELPVVEPVELPAVEFPVVPELAPEESLPHPAAVHINPDATKTAPHGCPRAPAHRVERLSSGAVVFHVGRSVVRPFRSNELRSTNMDTLCRFITECIAGTLLRLSCN